MTDVPYRVGVIGYGGIGRELVAALSTDDRFSVAFIHNRTASSVPAQLHSLVVADLSHADEREAQLIVEAAHPDYTLEYGSQFLTQCDYLPVSTSALSDDAVYDELVRVAAAHGTRLLLPHGALVGLDSFVAQRDLWASVTITFRKPPASLERADGTVHDIGDTTEAQLLYDGSVRGIARLYPRNVNSMITLALATKGLDETRAVLIADPTEQRGVLEISAIGHDGSTLTVRREQPMHGVSGTEMFGSILGSVHAAAASWPAGVRFV